MYLIKQFLLYNFYDWCDAQDVGISVMQNNSPNSDVLVSYMKLWRLLHNGIADAVQSLLVQ